MNMLTLNGWMDVNCSMEPSLVLKYKHFVSFGFFHPPHLNTLILHSCVAHHQSEQPYLLYLFKHPPLLIQHFSLLADQRPLLLTQEPLQLLDLILLAPEGLNQLLLALR